MLPFLLFLVLPFPSSSAVRLNVPRLLIPFSEEGADVVLRVVDDDDRGGGCYRWRSSKPEVVLVRPLFQSSSSNCSSSCSVSANSSVVWTRSETATVTAERMLAGDVSKGDNTLRCDVVVDAIHSVQIVSRTRQIFLEEDTPTLFQVRAFDDEGNEFSTLDRIAFKWIITKKSGSPQVDNLRFSSFRDLGNSPDEIRRVIGESVVNNSNVSAVMDLESSGKGHGNLVLVFAAASGSSRLSVRIASGWYSKVPPAEITVRSAANLKLVPSTAFLMVGAKLTLRADQVKGNKTDQIDLPSPQYLLQLDDPKIAALDFLSITLRAEALGSATVTLRDSNLPAHEDQIRPPPTARIDVVRASYIILSVSPAAAKNGGDNNKGGMTAESSWRVTVGRDYVVRVDIFDAMHNRIFPSDNVVVRVDLEDEHFLARAKTENGTWVLGSPVRSGLSVVRASLVGVTREDGRMVMEQPRMDTTGQMVATDDDVVA